MLSISTLQFSIIKCVCEVRWDGFSRLARNIFKYFRAQKMVPENYLVCSYLCERLNTGVCSCDLDLEAVYVMKSVVILV